MQLLGGASPCPDPAITDLGADLWGVSTRLHRLVPQRIRLPVPWAQARLLATIGHHGETRISDLIRITPEGQRMLSRIRADRAAVIDPQLAVLDPEDRQALGPGSMYRAA
jgi:hypothetical protein